MAYWNKPVYIPVICPKINFEQSIFDNLQVDYSSLDIIPLLHSKISLMSIIMAYS